MSLLFCALLLGPSYACKPPVLPQQNLHDSLGQTSCSATLQMVGHMRG
jgi:hypothetical protein